MTFVAVPRVSRWPSGTQRRTVLVVHSHQYPGDCSRQREKHILILGLGYTGSALANYIAHTRPEWSVTGTTRCNTVDTLQYPIHESVRVLDGVHFGQESIFSWDTIDCDMITHIVSTIPPIGGGSSSPDPVLTSVMQHRNAAFSNIVWAGYISTTSIYGNHNGDPVCEDSEIKETTSPRYAAEQQWIQCLGAHIFRCGGIYGPYRSVLDSIRASQKSLSDAQKTRRRRAVTFRCHVYDVCQSVEHSIERPCPGGAMYNIVDDDPSSRRDVEKYAYNTYFRMEPPHTNDQPLLPAEKMVMNTRMKDQLQVTLQYPTYKHGLDALVFHNDLRPFTFE